jgi:hypothetical protein
MRRLRSTLALFVLFLAIGGYAWFIERERPPDAESDAGENAFDVAAGRITDLTVNAANGDVTVLTRTENEIDWVVTAPIETEADDNAATAIATTLAALEVRRVVEEEAADLTPFGLNEPSVGVTFATPDGEPLRLSVGDESPTGGERYAAVGNRVILVANFVESTLNRTTFELRDRSILEFTGPDVTSLTVQQNDDTLRFAKADNRWRVVEPLEARADFGLVEAMVGRLGSGEMVAIESESATDDALEPFGLDTPRLAATVEVNGDRHSLLIGDENPAATVYARDAARQLVFTIDAALVDDLARGADTYRQKDLFDFRPFNAAALTVERGDRTIRFEKTSAAADEGAEEAAGAIEEEWRRVEPEPADVERAEMDTLLRALSELRADSFVASRDGTGLDAPLVTVTATYGDDAQEERVLIGRSGDATYGLRGDEPGAAVVDSDAVDAALEALDALDPGAAAD